MWIAASPFYIAAFISFNVITFLILVSLMRTRDVKGLRFGERLLNDLRIIDLQTSYILGALNADKEKQGSLQSVNRAFLYILSTLPDILGLDSKRHVEISLLTPIGDSFKVVAYSGIESYRIDSIEKNFRFGKESVSLAGVAMTQRKPVVINNLADENDPNVRYWVPTSPQETKSGSVLAFPITSGLSTLDSQPIAILCISTRTTNAFQDASLFAVLNYFAVKIEILQTILLLSAKSQ